MELKFRITVYFLALLGLLKEFCFGTAQDDKSFLCYGMVHGTQYGPGIRLDQRNRSGGKVDTRIMTNKGREEYG